MKGVAERIRLLREKSCKSENEVADAVGLSIHEYEDLEAYDNEIIDVLSLGAAKRVAAYLGQPLIQLLVPEKKSWPEVVIAPSELGSLARSKIEREQLSLEEAEDLVGWKLQRLFEDPECYLEENPIMFIFDLTGFLEVNWLSVLPSGGNS